jgi:hypothetical protein
MVIILYDTAAAVMLLTKQEASDRTIAGGHNQSCYLCTTAATRTVLHLVRQFYLVNYITSYNGLTLPGIVLLLALVRYMVSIMNRSGTSAVTA